MLYYNVCVLCMYCHVYFGLMAMIWRTNKLSLSLKKAHVGQICQLEYSIYTCTCYLGYTKRNVRLVQYLSQVNYIQAKANEC